MLNFKKYRSETDGNVAMMFAVTTLMLLTGVGAAIDYSNMTRAKKDCWVWKISVWKPSQNPDCPGRMA